jgi:exopolysaccharide biosynthesis polyprenyl glycosylphosphotransferase
VVRAAPPAPGGSAGLGPLDARTPAPQTTPRLAQQGGERLGRVASAPSRHWERLGLLATDVLAVNVAFYLAWFARYRLELVVELDPGRFVAYGVFVPLQIALSALVVFILALRGLYRLPRAATALDDASTIFTASGLALMAVFAGSTFVRYPAESRLTLIFAWVLITLLCVLGRAAYLWILGQLHGRGIGVARTLVVGDNTLGRMIMQAIAARPHLGYEVCGFLSDEGQSDFGRFRRLGPAAELERVIRERGIAQVVIALPSTSHEAIMRIVDHCRRDGVQFRVVPDLYEMSLGRVDLDTVSGLPLLGLKEASIRGLNLLIKRAIDAAVASVLLVALAPLFLLLALAIKLDDRSGPVLFGQTRVGRSGRHFTAWKFRSMRRNADALLENLLDRNEVDGPIFKMRHDPRRTRVGRYLRRWSLDELPQIWNVLVGDMSLVGPRPPTPREVAQYDQWHLQRLEAPPGITGLWQVSGRSQLGFDEMVMMDITYIENWSLGLDLRILLRTIPAVLGGKGAF